VAQNLSDQRQKERREYLHQLDTLAMPCRAIRTGGQRRRRAMAYELILGDAGKVFDLSQEKTICATATADHLRQSCLVAAGCGAWCPYITINYQGGWTPTNRTSRDAAQLPEMDKACDAARRSLTARLLDTTLVWWNGEFGRKPK